MWCLVLLSLDDEGQGAPIGLNRLCFEVLNSLTAVFRTFFCIKCCSCALLSRTSLASLTLSLLLRGGMAGGISCSLFSPDLLRSSWLVFTYCAVSIAKLLSRD